MNHAIAITLALLCVTACGDAQTNGVAPVDQTTVREEGHADVTVNGVTKRLRGLDARFTVVKESGDRDTLLLIVAASDGGESFNVTIEKTRQLDREPLSLAGTYEIRITREYSGILTMNWDGAETGSSDDGEMVGTLTIDEHEDGEIRGEIEAMTATGEDVRVAFEGPISGRCQVPAAEGSESDLDFVTFDHPFCSRYMQ